MATERRVLTIQLLPEQAALIEKVARLRSGQLDPQRPVDLAAYIYNVLNKDVAACISEIQARRRS